MEVIMKYYIKDEKGNIVFEFEASSGILDCIIDQIEQTLDV